MNKTETKHKSRLTKAAKPIQVNLSCHAPGAKEVFVAGTFNDWKPGTISLHNHLPNSEWAVTLPLSPGRHEYKFIVDHQWCCVPGTPDESINVPDCCANSLGTMNLVLEVS